MSSVEPEPPLPPIVESMVARVIANSIVRDKMHFSDTETGLFVTALRENVRKQVMNGLTNRSGGTWGPEGEKLDYEGKAKALLKIDWNLEHGHSNQIRCFDLVVSWAFNIQTGRWFIRVRWRMIRLWVGDQFRRVGARYRVWRDRNLVNPYA